MTLPACACGRMAPHDVRDELSLREYCLRTFSWLRPAFELGRPDPGLFEHPLAPCRIPTFGAGGPVTGAPRVTCVVVLALENAHVR